MRHHVVLIPGFGGFDVLGQIQYYTGITSFVDRWRKDPTGDNLDLRRTVELHYFDNLPTAAVGTRADRLTKYLAKRIARGSFQRADKLILVGHSTGGLDIRKLLQDLRLHPDNPIPVDNDANAVTASEILHVMSRIVFLSVPQYGTNIADWTISHNVERRIGISLISGFASTVLQVVPGKIIDVLGGFLLAQNLREAIRDAVRESSVILAGDDPVKLANAREAASELRLWLENIDKDFLAIQDLRNIDKVSIPNMGADDDSDEPDDKVSPAHYPPETRRRETTFWGDNGIKSMSFATLGKNAHPYKAGSPGDTWNPISLWGPYITSIKGCDSTYAAAWLACASGGFDTNTEADRSLKDIDDTQVKRRMEQWENDGIVNTASMLWPNEEKTILVHGDHADIIGHYKLDPPEVPGVVPAQDGSRQHDRYDLFVSAEDDGIDKFDDERFEKVWTKIFDFCIRQID
ncbi:hypothetical protein JCM24511_07662 [Saitozyma sp. JCM 24511]|nr:hypothetical protein JCM24511_07662 [Saitozyma sp. JCM 24511]